MHRTVLKLALIFQNEIQKRMNLSEIISPKTFLLSQPSWIGHIISNSKSLYSAHTQLVDCHNDFSVYLDLDGTNIVVFPNAVFELAAFYISVYITWPQMYLYFSPNAVQYFSWRRFIFLCIWPPGLWVGKPILPSSYIFVKQSKDTSIENSFSKTHTMNMAPIFTTLCCKILIFKCVCPTF